MVFYPALLCSIVEGWQDIWSFIRNNGTKHTMYSLECTFDPKALFLLENVLLKPMESFVGWLCILFGFPLICFWFPLLFWIFFVLGFLSLLCCFGVVVFQFPRCHENFAKLSVRKVVKAKASRRYVAVSFDPSFSAVMCCLSNLQFVIAAAKIVLSFQLTYAGLFNLGLIVAVWSNRGFCLLCEVFLNIPCTSGHVRRTRLSTHHYCFLVVLFFFLWNSWMCCSATWTCG